MLSNKIVRTSRLEQKPTAPFSFRQSLKIEVVPHANVLAKTKRNREKDKQTHFFSPQTTEACKSGKNAFTDFSFAKLLLATSTSSQGCQIFLGTTNQNGKNIPNDHNIPYQMVIKYSN
jgi:hypothetical protein